MKKVCVLCRGKSLLDINILPDDVDVYITVNRFSAELEDINISKKLKDKNLHHVTSLSPKEMDGMKANNCFKEYNYTELIHPYISETIPTSPLKVGDLVGKTLSDNCKEYMYKRHERPDGQTRYAYSFPTSGLAALCYATVDLEADDIHIIGLDFYDGVPAKDDKQSNIYAYIGSDLGDDETALKKGEDTNMMKDFFTNFVNKFTEKTFSLYTCSSYDENLKNLTVWKKIS
jgi:hypothetical protein